VSAVPALFWSFIPGIEALADVLVEPLPEWFGSARGRRARRRVVTTRSMRKAGRQPEAKAVFTELLTQLMRAPKYMRRVQAEWIALAEKALRS
jgi:hypothetical protein